MFMQIVNLLSKQDLKHFSKIDIPGFAGTSFSFLFYPWRETKLGSLQGKTKYEIKVYV